MHFYFFYFCCVCLPRCLVGGIVLVVVVECVDVVCFVRMKGSVFCVGIYFILCLFLCGMASDLIVCVVRSYCLYLPNNEILLWFLYLICISLYFHDCVVYVCVTL